MKQPRNIAILGSTGSIGCSSLEVIARFPEKFRVTYLSTYKNTGLLREQMDRFHPRGVAILDEPSASAMNGGVNGATEILYGEAGLVEMVRRDDVDLVISALVGFAGLRPTLAAIEAGKDIALANKETLVVAGELVMQKVREHGVQLLPVDSEHSAILQCLRGENIDSVERLILTASGGPFLQLDRNQFDSITVAQALNHPTWKMGNKITIDSATLMNKGLEVIEAFWLFGVPRKKIEVVIHPQSIIHSMVEFADGSIKAQMGVPDMKIPIQYALMYPERPAALSKKLDFTAFNQMTFLQPDSSRFRSLDLAFKALELGGNAPAVLNAANEVAVELFLSGQIPFSTIPTLVEEALGWHPHVANLTLEDVVRTDKDTREFVRQQSLTLQ